MEPRKLLSRLRQRIKGLEVLAGSNADEGTKALMYFSPYLFPNREIERAALSRHEFSSTVERIFAHLSKQVRNLLSVVHNIRPGNTADEKTYVCFCQNMQKYLIWYTVSTA